MPGLPRLAIAFAVAASLLAVVLIVVGRWPPGRPTPNAGQGAIPASTASQGSTSVRLSPQARKNLALVSQSLALTTYRRVIELPGLVIDRPGISDRGVVAPVTGVVTEIHVHPGDTVEPGATLFVLRLVSPSLHASQLELFKATKEIEIARQQRQRLDGLAQAGAVPQTRILEIENQLQRMEVNVQAYRQDLLARGLSPDQVGAAAQGQFVTEIPVRAPEETSPYAAASHSTAVAERPPFSFELQQLNVELGQQVEAGEVLCYLADHRSLLIEGRGFKEDMPRVQRAAERGLPVEVDFGAVADGDWPAVPRELPIDHVANTMDPESRTFAFFLSLANRWRAYERDGKTRLLWRLRPGERVRLRIAYDELKDVFVLPQAAVAREGPEAYVFRQNGDLFDRKPVHILAEDRTHVVIANDGSLRPGFFVAHNAAASLNRVLKAQSASGMPSGVHVHADGTVHGAH